MDTFDDTNWTVAQALAWAHTRDRVLVCHVGDNGLSAKVLLGGARQRFLAEEPEEELDDDEKRQLPQNRLEGAGTDLRLPPAPIAIVFDELSRKIEAGKLSISGIKRGVGQRETLDTLQLAGMCIFFDVGNHGDVLASRLPGATPRLDPNPELPWWGNLKFHRDEMLAVWPESTSADAARSTIAAKGRCRDWLISLMRGGPKNKTKTAYAAEAKSEFDGLSTRSFNKAWDEAIDRTGNIEWSKPGRRSPAA